jgi:hypothetical protein
LVNDPNVYPSTTIVYINSFYAMNMIHASDIWMFMLLNLGVFIECGNRLDIGMGAFAL